MIIGTQDFVAQLSKSEINGLSKLPSESYTSEPYPVQSPLNTKEFSFYRSNEWGGGDDAPDPNEPPTGGEALPVEDGMLFMISSVFIYIIVKRIRQDKIYK